MLEKKLEQNKNLRLDYTRCVNEYIKNGYMGEINETYDQDTFMLWYISHSAVSKAF